MKRDKVFTDWYEAEGLNDIVSSKDIIYRAYLLGKQGRKKLKKEPDPSFADFKNIWCEAYPIIGFEAGAVAGICINGIISDTRTALANLGRDTTPDELAKAFYFVINYVKSTKHFCHNQPLTTWKKMYLSIISKINEAAQPQLEIKPNSSQVYGKYGNQPNLQ